NQESRLPPGSDFRRWVWITIAPFVTHVFLLADCGRRKQGGGGTSESENQLSGNERLRADVRTVVACGTGIQEGIPDGNAFPE
ncbi:hypothetical protein, partial [Escherichia coli]|uniref:hypothetical protein n=1 Tax=Escherichia coli TaxID=562 RepID=UPI002AF6B68C